MRDYVTYYDEREHIACTSRFVETRESIDRFNGALYGAIMADAYAVGYEDKPNFKEYRIEKNYKVRKIARRQTFASNLLGGGRFHLKPGQVHYHSEWALVQHHALLNRKEFDEEEVAMEYALWARSNPPGMPDHIKRVLDVGDNCFDRKKFAKRMRRNAKNFNSNRVDIEVLIRQIPLAQMYRLSDIYTLMHLSERDTKLTHRHPMMIDAAKMFVIAIQMLLIGRDVSTVMNSIHAISRELNIHPLVHYLIDICANSYQYDFKNLPEEYKDDQPENLEKFGFEFHCAFIAIHYGHSYNPLDSIERAIKRSEDSPSLRTSLTGALAGAFHGISKLSGKWYVRMKRAPIRNRRVKALEFLRGETGARLSHRLRLCSARHWLQQSLRRQKMPIPEHFKIPYTFFNRDEQTYDDAEMPYPRNYVRYKFRPRYIRDDDDYAEPPPKPLIVHVYRTERDKAYARGEGGKWNA
uniref:ADP-ribosylhydrolase ARH3 n=1 Tax=Panagrellus redivivus TaxID=6233 RepID=A0A7E4VNI8_PANRE